MAYIGLAFDMQQRNRAACIFISIRKVYIYIYTYGERYRERESERARERESKRERERERERRTNYHSVSSPRKSIRLGSLIS